MTKRETLLWQHTRTGLIAGAFCFSIMYVFLISGTAADVLRNNYLSFFLLIPALALGKYYVDALRKNDALAHSDEAQQELVAELQEYKYALDQSAIITVIDERGKLKRVNENFEALTGFQSKDVIGRSVWRLSTSLQKRGAFHAIKRVTDKGQIWKGELEYYRQDGSTCYTSAIIVPLSQKVDGNNICLVIQYDITAERNAEMQARLELENQKEFTRRMINESENLLIVIDEQQHVRFINRKLQQFFNLDEALALGAVADVVNERNDIASLIKPEDIKATMPATTIYECRVMETATGEYKWFKVQRKVFADCRNQKHLLFIATDISEKQATQLKLMGENEAAEASLKTKEQFISNMSHEIRTPLNAIIGFTDLLDDTLLNEQQKDYVQTINNAGQNLLGIINDILDLSKLEAGNIQLASEPMNVSAIVQNIQKLFAPKVREKQIYLQTDISDTLPDIVYSDKTRLTQVLINLVGNAVKFTDKGGVNIEVKQGNGTAEGKAYLEFAVRDSGIGIEKSRQDVIFQRYAQGAANIHQTFGGTGLGLSISKNLVELFGGEIMLASEQGTGTAISFTIPLSLSTAENAKELAPVIAQHLTTVYKPLRILLAEDNNVNAKLAMQLLKKKNFEVDRVKDGKEVIELLQQNIYDVILMDIQMIEQDGIETTKIIRASSMQQHDIPIIALTAHSFIGEREVCRKAGMNAYISKPFRPEELYSTILKTIANNQEVLAAA